MFGAHSTCVSVHRVIRICVGVPTARGDSHKPSAGLFAPPDDTDGARWLDHLRARATSADADSMPELGHGLWKPWHWPWSGRRPWTEWPSAFGRRALFSLSSAFGRTAVTTNKPYSCNTCTQKAFDRGILRSCVTFSPPRARLELKFTTAVVMLAICIMVGLYTWTWSDKQHAAVPLGGCADRWRLRLLHGLRLVSFAPDDAQDDGGN